MKIKKKHSDTLKEFLKQNGLNENSKLFRYTANDYLLQDVDVYYIKAKDECSDMAIDIYEDKGHVFVSQEFGKGLSFLSKPEPEYEKENRVCVELNLKDVFDQGGLIYEITSLPAYLKGYFVSLPEGKVKVTRL